MRPTVPLLALALAALALLALPVTAPAARCAKGTTPVGSAKAPKACVSAMAAAPERALRKVVTQARRAPKGARRSRRAERIARSAFAFATGRIAADQPVFTVGPAKRSALRAGSAVQVTNAPRSLGRQVRTTVSRDGHITATFDNDGVTVRMGVDESQDFTMDIRDRTGAGAFFTFDHTARTPRCPTAAGDVPSRFDGRITYGEATAAHGRRHWTSATFRFDGPWRGQVGVGALAERFDLALRGALEIRSGVEIAATGKVLRRDATRTYRAALDRTGVPVGTSGRSLAGDLRLRGPKGTRWAGEDRVAASALVTEVARSVDRVTTELRDGDHRWYEQRRCARTVVQTRTPERVTKGAAAQWVVQATTATGEPVADARWSAASACGELAAETTTGPVLRMTVTDRAGAWGPDPRTPACATAEVTTTAGRAAPFADTIEPEQPADLRVAIDVTYHEDMGDGIAKTDMRGVGTVDLGWRERTAEGTGGYDGTEWDGGIGNPCGADMLRTRGFTGTATVGVSRNRDGTLSVAFTANERPLRMSFLAVVTTAGGTQFFNTPQPFCGEVGRALTSATMRVTVTPLPPGP